LNFRAFQNTALYLLLVVHTSPNLFAFAENDDLRKRCAAAVAAVRMNADPLSNDFFKRLGFTKEENPNSNRIKKAYRKLCRIFHPDGTAKLGTDIPMKNLAEAYETLTDDSKRGQYLRDKHPTSTSPETETETKTTADRSTNRGGRNRQYYYPESMWQVRVENLSQRYDDYVKDWIHESQKYSQGDWYIDGSGWYVIRESSHSSWSFTRDRAVFLKYLEERRTKIAAQTPPPRPPYEPFDFQRRYSEQDGVSLLQSKYEGYVQIKLTGRRPEFVRSAPMRILRAYHQTQATVSNLGEAIAFLDANEMRARKDEQDARKALLERYMDELFNPAMKKAEFFKTTMAMAFQYPELALDLLRWKQNKLETEGDYIAFASAFIYLAESEESNETKQVLEEWILRIKTKFNKPYDQVVDALIRRNWDFKFPNNMPDTATIVKKAMASEEVTASH